MWKQLQNTVWIWINRFFVKGEGNIKYSYNNSYIAGDSLLTSRNFIGAQEKIP
jgi:hypothetical protein